MIRAGLTLLMAETSSIGNQKSTEQVSLSLLLLLLLLLRRGLVLFISFHFILFSHKETTYKAETNETGLTSAVASPGLLLFLFTFLLSIEFILVFAFRKQAEKQ